MKEELEKKEEEKTSVQDGSIEEKKPDDKGSEASKTRSQEEGVDVDFYKKEVELLNSKLSKAEKKVVSLKREKKRLEEDEVPQLNEEEIERRILSKIQERERASYISRVAKNDDHAELIRHHLENTIKPTGNIKEDVENAILQADKKRIFSEMESLKHVAVSNNTAQGASYSGVKKKLKEEKPEYTEKELQFLKKFGVEIN